MQRIGKSRWRPLELCYWPEQGALPANGKEDPGLGYKRLRDDPSPRAQQQQQPAVAQRYWACPGMSGRTNFNCQPSQASKSFAELRYNVHTGASSSDLGSRFNLSVQTLLSTVFPSTRPTCGLLHWDSYVLVSDRVVLPDGVRPAAVAVFNAVFNAVYIGSGRIHHIMEDTSVSGPKVLRFKSAVISPGAIDVHVHLNEPGREEWEGIETGTRAAVVGGVTTVVDMPLNSFPVKANANIAYWAGLVPANAANHTVLQALLDGGARGFKAFMSPSGINDFANVDAPDIAAALPFLKQAGVPLFVHAERVEAGPDTVEVMLSLGVRCEGDRCNPYLLAINEQRFPHIAWMEGMYRRVLSTLQEALEAERPDVLELLRTRLLPVLVGLLANLFAWRSISQGDPRLYQTYLDSRPPAMEQAAIQMLIKLLDEDKASAAPGFVVHIAHLSDAGCLGLIQASLLPLLLPALPGSDCLFGDAQARHPISVETVPHYLHFNSEAIAAGQTQFKCAPPIRDAHNKVALRRALASGAINLVSSDHSPAPPAMKHTESGLFTEAWGGIAGLQYLVPATWTALSQTGAGLERLTAVLSEEPAKLAGFAGRKGQLAPGFDADIMVWEPESPADTSIAANQHKHKLTPYTDLPLLGKVVGTIVQGHFVFMSGAMSPTACGEPL
ncbi:hypothetical protein QJQ45_008138 [Haematococcus lacustris]|nr:hypothetical protein QJQ45_008138 [Haematococcus lacustris]